ncbi:unnamed protein product [Durusdinium trenchii]|uniref:Plastid lipid-associated protein/fibrillin conserved domain-containing protein n=1 Tax=Durusdinium trenchii TaxID=1381693 RepID=A0ABP0QG53_9DINO
MGIPPAAMSELGGLTVACRDFGPVPTQRRAPALFQRKAPLRGPKQSGLGWAVMAGAGSAAASACHAWRCKPQRAQRTRTVVTCAAGGANAAELKSELLEILAGENWDASRVEAAQRVEDLVQALIETYESSKVPDQEAQRLLEGRWQLLSTFTPGQAAANLFSLKSWQEYVFGKGPSPVQAAAFTNNAVQKVYQVLDLSVSPKRWYNVIDATPAGIICLEADLTSQDADVRFQWTGGQIIVKRPPWSQEDLPKPIRLPYPVPFALLGDRARGIFETAYLDEDLRGARPDSSKTSPAKPGPSPGISRGSKSGSVFVLRRESNPLPMEDVYFSQS